MNLKFRRTLYFSFIFIFIMVGSAMLFYLQGYRYNQNKGKIERTGALVVDSIPRSASIHLNGVLYNHKTPIAIQSLNPADYEVTLNYDGAQNWRKVLNVKPSLVTFTGKVRLWPAPAIGERLAGADLSNTLLSPNRENLLYRSTSGLNSGWWLLNLTSGKITLLSRQSTNPETTVEWSPESLEILVQQKNNKDISFQTFSLEDKTWEPLLLPQDITPQIVRWGESDNQLYIATSDELYQFNRRSQTLKLLWREQLKDFRAHDGLIFGLSKGLNNALSLKILNRANLKIIPLTETPSLSTSLQFLESKNEWLPLYDQDRHALYLLHSPLTDLDPIRTLPDVNTIDWSPDGQQILLTNNFEIWQYQIEEDKLNLALRVSTPLTQARLLNDEPYLLFTSGTKLWALELDNRGEQQRWVLGEYKNNIQDLFLDPQNKAASIKTADGLFYLKLNLESDDGVLPINWP